MTSPFRYDGSRDAEVPDTSIGARWANDQADNPCFGCRQVGEPGLRMTFTRTGERTVESHLEIPATYAGWKTVVHGGVSAVVLDEVMGACTWAALGGGVDNPIVTKELTTRYRKPTPVGMPIVAKATVDEIDDRYVHVSGQIELPDGTVLTEAEGIWRRLDPSRVTG